MERDVLNHVGQKLEVVNVADEVQAVHLRKADKYVLWDGRSQAKTHTSANLHCKYNTCITCMYWHSVADMQQMKWMLSYSQLGLTE